MPPPIGGGGSGGSGGGGPVTVSRSQALSVVVNDFGAIAGGPDCSAAFEAARAALSVKLAAYPGAIGTIYWTGDPRPYLISRPMDLQRDFTEIASLDGQAEIWQAGGGSCVLIGMRQTEPVYGGTLRLLDARSTLAADYPAGGLTLTLAPGTGASFGDPVTVAGVIARPTRVLLDDGAGNRCVLGVANRTGDVLTLQDDGTGHPRHYDDGMGADTPPVFAHPDRAFPAGSAVSHEHRPDLFGKLGPSAAPAVGSRRGIRLWGDTSLFFQGNALALGKVESDGVTWDGYGSCDTLTIEVLVESADGGPWRCNPGAICNIGNGGDLRPFGIGVSATNNFSLTFATADNAPHSITGTPGPAASGPIGICWQFTLGATKSCQVYVRNPDGTGTQVAANVGADAAFWAGTTPQTLRRNDFAGMLFARQYNDLRAPCQDNGWNSQDFTLCGFLISAGKRYKDKGVGQSQERVDGGVVDDRYRYFNGDPAFSDPAVIAYIAMTDAATTSRLVTAIGQQSRRSFGYLIQGAQTTMVGAIKGNALRGLKLRGSGTMPVVQLAAFLDVAITDCDIDGGTSAIACLNLIASYPLILANVRLGGTWAPLYAAWTTLTCNGVTFATNGRVPMRIWAANAAIRDINVVNFGSGFTEAIVWCHGGGYGGLYEFRSGFVDAEGTSLSPAQGAFVIEPILGIPATTCIIEDWYMGTMGAAPLVRARMAGSNPTCRLALHVGPIQCDGDGVALDLDAATVVGEFTDVYGTRGGEYHRSNGYAGTPNVTFTRTGA